MAFPHSGSERHSLHTEAIRAIKSHGQPIQFLDPETRNMRERMHSGIELTGVELAYLKKLTFDRIKTLESDISSLDRSLRERTAVNYRNAEDELLALREELDFLQDNLAEKLFADKKIDGEVSDQRKEQHNT